MDHQALLKQFEYLNHMNPHTFEVDDLDLLIKSVNFELFEELLAGLSTCSHCSTSTLNKTAVEWADLIYMVDSLDL